MTDTYEVGPFQLDPSTSLLTLSGAPVALGRRATGLLAALVRSPQQWMSKAQLLEAAWPGLLVEESNLPVQISSLRRVLSQAPGGEQWIETLVGRGYRFVGPVRTISPPGAAKTLPPSALGRNHSLPTEIDTFVGRTAVLSELSSACSNNSRVLSIVGTGGVGKTRLAQRFGWTHLSQFSGGVWFCDLSAARTKDSIAHAVARGLDVPIAGADPLAQLTRVIAERGECLVILDNFEQVARLAAETLVHWAERAPMARFVVTTRELLGIPGELVLTLDPLDTEDATTLFLQRAGAAGSQFNPTADDRPAILQIAKLLDCLPLAIELAAARVRVLSPQSLLQRMDHQFSILPSARARTERHTTLRATFDWSWDLLEPHERSALAHLSVFEGGFTLDAVQAVLDHSDPKNEWSAVDLVQGLVEKSLVHRPSEHRFTILDTIKTFAAERLESDPQCGGPDVGRSARARHYRYFANLDESRATAQQGAELDNLVAACLRSAKDEVSQSAVGALGRAWEVFWRTGPYRAAFELADAVASMQDLNESQRAVVEWVAGMALFSLGRAADAIQRFERGLAASRATGDRRTECLLLAALADPIAGEGRVEQALEHAGQALAIGRELDDRSLQCGALNRLGAVLWRAGRLADASESYTTALQIARETADRRMQGMLMGNLGIIHQDLGELEQARSLYEQSLQAAVELGDRQGEAVERGNVADMNLHVGATAAARVQFEAALTIGRFLGHARTEFMARNGLGRVFAAEGDLAGAREQFRRAVELAHETGDRRGEGRVLSNFALSLARLGAWPEARDRFVTAESLLRAARDPQALVELYCRWAEAALSIGDSPAGAELFGRAEKAALAIGRPYPRPLEAMLQHVRSRLTMQ